MCSLSASALTDSSMFFSPRSLSGEAMLAATVSDG